MRARIAVALVVVGLSLANGEPGRAARDPSGVRAGAKAQELIILEAPNCIHCAVFRRDVLPSYQRSARASDLPIRFLDVNDPAADQLKLDAAIAVVPTAVVMRDGREAGRLTGYWGPEAFFKAIGRIVGDAD